MRLVSHLTVEALRLLRNVSGPQEESIRSLHRPALTPSTGIEKPEPDV